MGEILSFGVNILLFITLYFEVFLLMTFFENEGQFVKAASKNPLERYPRVTIAVPCYNEERTVLTTVQSLLALDYPREMLEIIVVDDGSTDKTWEVIQQFKDNPCVRIFRKENGGKHTVLNFALQNSTGEFFGCLDADSFVDPFALTAIVRMFEDESIMAVTPAIITASNHTAIQKLQKAEYSISVFFRRVFSHLDSIFITPGPFSFFRRSVFEKLGNYRAAHHTEDLEIAMRMQMNHMRIANTPEAHVYTNTPRTIRALHRQRLRWVYGFLRNALDYKHMFFKREYGNLGILLLPMSAISIFSALYLVVVLLYSIAQIFISKYVEITTIGVRLYEPSFGMPDWFYVNTSTYTFLIILALGITSMLALIGKRLVDEPYRFPIDIFYYLTLYGFLAPFWLGRAVYNAARKYQSSWTAERQ